MTCQNICGYQSCKEGQDTCLFGVTVLQRKNGKVDVKNYLGDRFVNLSREVMLFRSQIVQKENQIFSLPKFLMNNRYYLLEVYHHKPEQ